MLQESFWFAPTPFLSKRELARSAALLAACVCIGALAAGGGDLDKELPSLDGLVRYGCTVKGPIQQLDYGDPSGKVREVWSASFWAEHKEASKSKPRKDWELLYSYRHKRMKALADCDKFLERVAKAAQEHRLSESDRLARLTGPRN